MDVKENIRSDERSSVSEIPNEIWQAMPVKLSDQMSRVLSRGSCGIVEGVESQILIYETDLGVSKNSGTPKWMGFIMENPINMDDLGVPLFLETPIWTHYTSLHPTATRYGAEPASA